MVKIEEVGMVDCSHVPYPSGADFKEETNSIQGEQ